MQSQANPAAKASRRNATEPLSFPARLASSAGDTNTSEIFSHKTRRARDHIVVREDKKRPRPPNPPSRCRAQRTSGGYRSSAALATNAAPPAAARVENARCKARVRARNPGGSSGFLALDDRARSVPQGLARQKPTRVWPDRDRVREREHLFRVLVTAWRCWSLQLNRFPKPAIVTASTPILMGCWLRLTVSSSTGTIQTGLRL